MCFGEHPSQRSLLHNVLPACSQKRGCGVGGYTESLFKFQLPLLAVAVQHPAWCRALPPTDIPLSLAMPNSSMKDSARPLKRARARKTARLLSLLQSYPMWPCFSLLLQVRVALALQSFAQCPSAFIHASLLLRFDCKVVGATSERALQRLLAKLIKSCFVSLNCFRTSKRDRPFSTMPVIILSDVLPPPSSRSSFNISSQVTKSQMNSSELIFQAVSWANNV